MHMDRMRKLLQAVTEHPPERAFTMSMWCYCTFGIYCGRRDLQATFIMPLHCQEPRLAADPAYALLETFAHIAEHFEISKEEALYLFKSEGCAIAESAPAAARYIAKMIELEEAISAMTEPTDPGPTSTLTYDWVGVALEHEEEQQELLLA